jgi:hypothetical protein
VILYICIYFLFDGLVGRYSCVVDIFIVFLLYAVICI